MTFEEFFKKKKIDLALLQNGEPALFAEFKHHFEQMGEKSFDHTKKYWFNKLRLKFPAPAEIKTEKVHIENQIAEQTIVDALSETLAPAPAPSTGFKPRFKAAITKPAEEAAKVEERPTEEKPAETPAPAVGFKPRFKAAMVTKPAEETPAPEQPALPQETNPAEETPKPVGFKPRFNAAMVKKPVEDMPAPTEEKKELPAEDTTAADTPLKPVGFKPRFKPKE